MHSPQAIAYAKAYDEVVLLTGNIIPYEECHFGESQNYPLKTRKQSLGKQISERGIY